MLGGGFIRKLLKDVIQKLTWYILNPKQLLFFRMEVRNPPVHTPWRFWIFGRKCDFRPKMWFSSKLFASIINFIRGEVLWNLCDNVIQKLPWYVLSPKQLLFLQMEVCTPPYVPPKDLQFLSEHVIFDKNCDLRINVLLPW